MQLHVSPNNGLPIYMQIVDQIKFLVASGRLKSGDELLPIRTLAEQLVINPNTVARAYRELESEGLLSSRRGAGTYVTDRGSPLARHEQERILGERVDSMLVTAKQLGFSREATLHLVRERADHLGLTEGEVES
ncbi:MAG: GntR family transcriptional regulator [Candidatus Hydrogenedentes bacterium]|nr:GntR family transcriptional regulator [Candidatus Hydrogenedentota bacterium]